MNRKLIKAGQPAAQNQNIPPPPGGGSWRWDGAAWQPSAVPPELAADQSEEATATESSATV